MNPSNTYKKGDPFISLLGPALESVPSITVIGTIDYSQDYYLLSKKDFDALSAPKPTVDATTKVVDEAITDIGKLFQKPPTPVATPKPITVTPPPPRPQFSPPHPPPERHKR